MNLLEQFKAARRVGVPIMAIKTPDPAVTVKKISKEYPSDPILEWDVIRGIVGLNPMGNDWARRINTVDGNVMPAAAVTGNPIEALGKSVACLPGRAILFFHNAHLYVEKGGGDSHKPVIQAIWNTRDPFKSTFRILILLVPQIDLPVELKNDVLVIDEPLPNDRELAAIITQGLIKAGAKRPSKSLLPKLVDAVSGLAAFNAEQALAMSVNPKNKRVSPRVLWHHKITMIEQEKGLKIHTGGSRFSDIGGNDNIKELFLKIIRGKNRPRLVVFIDEIEKATGSAMTESSGTTMDQLKVLLTEMQDNDWSGLILYGFAGTGKSELAKAFGNEAGCKTVEADLGAMKNKWVGSSEARMRSFIKTVKAMSGGSSRVFFVATCNHVQVLRPEFKRRFRKGIFFCDLPGPKERGAIWKIYLKKFEIDPHQERPNDEGWTGAEIRVCCENAHELNVPLKEAAKFMTITSQAMGKEVEEMRRAASGKYVDAQNPGVFTYTPNEGFWQKADEPLEGGE